MDLTAGARGRVSAGGSLPPSRSSLKKRKTKTTRRIRIVAAIANPAGNTNPLKGCAPMLEVFSTLEIGTMIRVVLSAVKGRFTCVELLGEAD